MAVLVHLFSADGAVFMRQIKAGAVAAVGDKFAVPAFAAKIVRRQRVDLGNSCHGGHKRGADRATGADLIAFLVGTLNQLLGNHVQHRKAVLGDGIQLTVQALFHKFRQRIAVHFLGTRGCNTDQILLRAGDAGRECPLGDGPDIFHAVRNFARVFDDDLPCCILRKIVKFPQHLFGGTEVQRRLGIGILEAHAGHQNLPELGVFFLQKMHITGGDHGLIKVLTQFEDCNVKILQLLDILDLALPQHKQIVAEWLYLQIVVKGSDPAKFRPLLPFPNGVEQLAGFAGGADQQPLPVLHQQTFGDAGLFVEILQVGSGDDLVEIF